MVTSNFNDVEGRKNPSVPNMLQSVPKWLYELLGVPCFNGNIALVLKEYAAMLERGRGRFRKIGKT